MILVYLILFLLTTFHSDKSFMISVRNSLMMHKSRISASKINEVAYSYEQNNNNINNNNNNNNNNKIKNNLLNLLINDLLISSKNAKLSIDMLKLNISNGDSIEDTSYQNNDNNNYSKLSWNDSKSFLLTLLLFQKIQLIHSSENNNKNNNDPFSKMKMNELFNTLVFIEDLALIIPDTIELEKEQLLENCLYLSLLTSSPSEYISVSKQNAFNSDNNNLTLKKKKMMFYNFISEIKNKKNNVLLDDVTKISNFLNSLAYNSNSNSNNNDINNDDNSDNNYSKNIHIGICPGSIGKELISDLFLTYSLISSGICSTCTIFTSSYSLGSKLTPTTSDILAHVSFLSDPSSSDSWGVRHLGAAIQTLIINGNIIIHEDLVWTRPTNFHWEMENNDNSDNNNINNNNNNDFKEVIKSCDLLIMKGELNYCRLEKYDGQVLVNDNIVVVEPSPYVSICSVRFNNNNEDSRVTSAIEFIKKS